MRKRWRYGIIGVLLVGLLSLFSWTVKISERADNAKSTDLKCMYDLGSLAREMIAGGGAGVSEGSDRPIITSFSAFYDYVAKKRPNAVSSLNASNPFPGILPGTEYSHPEHTNRASSDFLICSQTYDRPIGKVTHCLQCDGNVKVEIKK